MGKEAHAAGRGNSQGRGARKVECHPLSGWRAYRCRRLCSAPKEVANASAQVQGSLVQQQRNMTRIALERRLCGGKLRAHAECGFLMSLVPARFCGSARSAHAKQVACLASNDKQF